VTPQVEAKGFETTIPYESENTAAAPLGSTQSVCDAPLFVQPRSSSTIISGGNEIENVSVIRAMAHSFTSQAS
jgi:hypothetical protein